MFSQVKKIKHFSQNLGRRRACADAAAVRLNMPPTGGESTDDEAFLQPRALEDFSQVSAAAGPEPEKKTGLTDSAKKRRAEKARITK